MNKALLKQFMDDDKADDTATEIVRIVKAHPAGGAEPWCKYLSEWDRRFVLSIFDLYETHGEIRLSAKQAVKGRVILEKLKTGLED